MKFSIIIPVFNRPDEVDELLESLSKQTFKDFEIIIVEDGSEKDCKNIVDKHSSFLDIKYFQKENEGPGLTRNFGMQKATSDYFVFFDSDCIIPENYFTIVDKFLTENYVDAFGGPDMAHPNFSNIQKAISYSMTSFFTTGGIRGGQEKLDKFYPRSFNMGLSREVFNKTNGFSKMRFGEDVDLSIRIIENGFKTALIKDAKVYHKRRTDLGKFFKQVHNSGIARINLYKKYPKSLKLVHFLPAFFTIGSGLIVLISLFYVKFFLLLVIFSLLIFIDSFIKNKSFLVALYSVAASFVQLIGYGSGFIVSFWNRIILRKEEFHAFKNNFYK